MAQPTLTPSSQTSKVILPSSSTPALAEAATFPFSVYTSDRFFLSGAADQVAYTYNKLGGDVLDIELKAENVSDTITENTQDTMTILENYVDDLDVKNLNKNRLKGMLKGLYVEASNMEI